MAIAELAKRLIAIDSTSARSNRGVIDLLADRLASIGFRVAIQAWEADGVAKANLVACAGPPVEGGLILSGHTDTVPWEGQAGWEREATNFAMEGNRVFGRGTSDMKVFLAQAVAAASAAGTDRLRRPLVFLFTADEEVGCLGADRLAPELNRLLETTPTPRLCWIGEPTSWEVFRAHKSVALFDVIVRGRGGHSGLPTLGTNAIGAAGAVIAEIGRYQEELRRSPSQQFLDLFPDAPHHTVNFGEIAGGTAANVIAEECRIRLSTRGLPDADPLECYHEIARRLRALTAVDPASPVRAAEISLGEPFSIPAFESPQGTPLEQALFHRLGRSDVRGALLGADACRFAPLGINCLICGPGEFDQAHQPNESISRKAFEEGEDVVRSVIERLCVA